MCSYLVAAVRRLGSAFALTGALFAQESFVVSTDASLTLGNGASGRASLSADGLFLAFESDATNLVSSDTNAARDVFWRDLVFGTTRRVSVTSAGVQANGASQEPSLAADGRYVVFSSDAAGLAAPDSNLFRDVFRHDVETGVTELVSVGMGGATANGPSQTPDVSGDGSLVVFASAASNLTPGDSNGLVDIFLRDMASGVTTLISSAPGGANGASFSPRISDDGLFVCYSTDASNLTSGDVNGLRDIVVYDVQLGVTLPVTANPFTVIGNALSTDGEINADGEYVAFMSFASNLVPNDTNGVQDVFRWRRGTGNIVRASVSSSGAQTPGQSITPSISSNGGRVAFASFGHNLVPGDTNVTIDVFVRDFAAGTTTRVSVDSSGAQANAGSTLPSISGDSTAVAFQTLATNLFAGDGNSASDVVVHGDRCRGAEVYCTAKVNSNGCTPSICSGGAPSLSGPDDFHVTAFRVLNQKAGMFFWGHAPIVAPFFGGTRCVAYPVQRAPLLNSGGNPSVNDCSGMYDFHFSQNYMQTWSLGVGAQMYGQFWSRDPFLAPPNNVGLTDAVYFVIAP